MPDEPTPFELPPQPIELPVDGVLDLHPFAPRVVKELVPDYLALCQERGVLLVRLIHGKGIGALRRTVHALLARHPEVVEYWVDHALFSGSGATLVRLRSRPGSPGEQEGATGEPRVPREPRETSR